MKHYLALIRKADFTDLYKFGHLHINGDMKTEFDVPIEELPKHIEFFTTLSKNANSFDNAFVYLIIHYTKTGDVVDSNDVYIEEVNNIYPLDMESKKNFEMSFDERIRIEEPIWKDAVLELQMHQEFLSCKKGANNIMRIVGHESSEFRCEDIITDEIIEELVQQLYNDKRPSGDNSIWVYLLRYERHSFYPKNILGCFMDMVNVVCNKKAEREVDAQEIKKTGIFQLLDSLRGQNELKFADIYNAIQENAKPFVELTKIYESRIDFIKVATLFLVLHDKYSDDYYYEKEFIASCIKFYKDDFILAIFMLGIVLGHNHTYDCLYENLPLSIYKVKKQKDKTEEKQEKGKIEEKGHPERPFQEGSSESGEKSDVNIQSDGTEMAKNIDSQSNAAGEEELKEKNEQKDSSMAEDKQEGDSDMPVQSSPQDNSVVEEESEEKNEQEDSSMAEDKQEGGSDMPEQSSPQDNSAVEEESEEKNEQEDSSMAEDKQESGSDMPEQSSPQDNSAVEEESEEKNEQEDSSKLDDIQEDGADLHDQSSAQDTIDIVQNDDNAESDTKTNIDKESNPSELISDSLAHSEITNLSDAEEKQNDESEIKEKIVVVESKMNRQDSDNHTEGDNKKDLEKDKDFGNSTLSDSVVKAETQVNATKATMRTIPPLPCMMGVPKRNGGFKKTPKPIKVSSRDKYIEYLDKGYQVIPKALFD